MSNSSNYTYSFEKLVVWQRSQDLTVEIYTLTKIFPSHENFGLTSQLRRAAVSICSNLAEGNARTGEKDRIKFFTYSYSSLMEVLNQLILAKRLTYMSEEKLAELRLMVDEIANKIIALSKANTSK